MRSCPFCATVVCYIRESAIGLRRFFRIVFRRDTKLETRAELTKSLLHICSERNKAVTEQLHRQLDRRGIPNAEFLRMQG